MRKERSDEATQRGRGTQDGETEEEIERGKRGRTKDGSVDGKMEAQGWRGD